MKGKWFRLVGSAPHSPFLYWYRYALIASLRAKKIFSFERWGIFGPDCKSPTDSF
jgi:hypothetical protein